MQVIATDAALAAIERLTAKHGPLMLCSPAAAATAAPPSACTRASCSSDRTTSCSATSTARLSTSMSSNTSVGAGRRSWSTPPTGRPRASRSKGSREFTSSLAHAREPMEADMTVDTAGFREAHHELRDQTAELRLAAERVPELANDEREEARARDPLVPARAGRPPHEAR